MQRLIEGHSKFLAEIFPKRKQDFQALAASQAPESLFITCSDSRIRPDLIFGAGPGDLFIGRNIGNVIPRTADPGDGMGSVIEYAVEVLHVKHAIVCGHSNCGAMKAASSGKPLDNLPKTERWLRHVQGAFQNRQPLNPADGDAAELASLIRGNVVAQLESLKLQPSVSSAMQRGELTVHGWYYDISTGRVERYDEKLRRFVPLAEGGFLRVEDENGALKAKSR